ncbi:unnamed protein product [Phyllotreta striolata]|uniref:Uncharacterized protein n=1 Tax=Phyllotreta striolata TaxID=444603 RepID=A0A9N9TUU2_PHYSR|nr:unnamed protein product [Phyllotreta striolata]
MESSRSRPKRAEEGDSRIFRDIEGINRTLGSSIEALETRLLVKFGYQNKKIRELQELNEHVQSDLEALERQLRSSNILVYGLGRAEPSRTTVCDALKRLVRVDVKPSDIKNAYYMGKSETSPLKVEFSCYRTKMAVLKNGGYLRGTGVKITEDLTKKQRDELKVLQNYCNKEKQKGIYKRCFIVGNKLVLDNQTYTYEQLGQIDSKNRWENANANAKRDCVVERKPSRQNLQEFSTCKQISPAKERVEIRQEEVKAPKESPSVRIFQSFNAIFNDIQKRLENFASKF